LCDTTYNDSALATTVSVVAAPMEAACALMGRMGERREIKARRAVLAHDLGEMAVEEGERAQVACGDGGMVSRLVCKRGGRRGGGGGAGGKAIEVREKAKFVSRALKGQRLSKSSAAVSTPPTLSSHSN
jgi:hypothetical protein